MTARIDVSKLWYASAYGSAMTSAISAAALATPGPNSALACFLVKLLCILAVRAPLRGAPAAFADARAGIDIPSSPGGATRDPSPVPLGSSRAAGGAFPVAAATLVPLSGLPCTLGCDRPAVAPPSTAADP